jgi:predicted metal-dependent phosphoesterase TrpH
MYSYDGTASIAAILKYAAEYTRLNVLAITDHDSTRGVREAMQLAPRYNLQVIPGCEISSNEGHVLALFIDQPIRAGLSLLETLLRVGDQGGICVAAHPMAKGVNSLRFSAIRDALEHTDAAKVLVGVETFNGGLVYTRGNKRVAEECSNLPLAQTGNSDAHILPMIGQAYTYFPGQSALDLRTALVCRQTSAYKEKGLTGVAILTSYVPQYLLRKLGWVRWNAHPAASFSYASMKDLLRANSQLNFSQS